MSEQHTFAVSSSERSSNMGCSTSSSCEGAVIKAEAPCAPAFRRKRPRALHGDGVDATLFSDINDAMRSSDTMDATLSSATIDETSSSDGMDATRSSDMDDRHLAETHVDRLEGLTLVSC
jgi:hypothetical protein